MRCTVALPPADGAACSNGHTMNALQIAALVLVAVGVLLILLGAFMSLNDWRQKRACSTPRDSLGDTLSGLGKLLDALKDYPAGQQLIVLGIVVLIVAGIFGGVSGLK
jgi:uncharacterized membrane protein